MENKGGGGVGAQEKKRGEKVEESVVCTSRKMLSGVVGKNCSGNPFHYKEMGLAVSATLLNIQYGRYCTIYLKLETKSFLYTGFLIFFSSNFLKR